jgi:hypothetical protein
VNSSAVHGYWSREIVDAAIANLGPKGTNKLTWRPKEAPAPPPPPSKPEPVEVLGTLPNGEPKLPLDSSEAVLRKASLAQVKEWRIRKKSVDGVQYRRTLGGFSSRF